MACYNLNSNGNISYLEIYEYLDKDLYAASSIYFFVKYRSKIFLNYNSNNFPPYLQDFYLAKCSQIFHRYQYNLNQNII